MQAPVRKSFSRSEVFGFRSEAWEKGFDLCFDWGIIKKKMWESMKHPRGRRNPRRLFINQLISIGWVFVYLVLYYVYHFKIMGGASIQISSLSLLVIGKATSEKHPPPQRLQEIPSSSENFPLWQYFYGIGLDQSHSSGGPIVQLGLFD